MAKVIPVNLSLRQPFQKDQGTTMNRLDVTEKIVSAKVSKGLKWADVAKKVGQSKE